MSGLVPKSPRRVPATRAESDPHADEIVEVQVKNHHALAVELAEFLLAVLDSDQTST